jgi:glycosyltransferase involved in cell wall biosynthesis
MKVPLVSIIMPAYNAEKYIEESIQSVVNQTCKNWELIIVDDGSTDHTSINIKKHTELDERIFYYYQKNSKQGRARNYGISKAKGKYIAFLDADDIWFANKLDHQLDSIQEEKVELVFSDAIVFNNLNEIDFSKTLKSYKGFCSPENGIDLFLEKNQIPILTVLITKNALEKVNFFTEKLEIQNLEDYHLWLKLLFSGVSFFGADTALAGYREHEASVSIKDIHTGEKKLIYLLKDLRKLFPAQRERITKIIRAKTNQQIKNNLFYFVKNALSKAKKTKKLLGAKNSK